MKRFRLKSIKQMFTLFLLITLLVVVILSAFAFVFLYKNIKSAKESAIHSLCSNLERIIVEHDEAVSAAELVLHTDRDIAEFLNGAAGEDTETLRVNAADKMRATVSLKDMELGAVLFGNTGDEALLCTNTKDEEKKGLEALVGRYREDPDQNFFVLQADDSLFSELYVCRFSPVVYHSLKEVNFYEVGTMAIFSKINIYELKSDAEKSSRLKFGLLNDKTGEYVALADNTGQRTDRGTHGSQRIAYTDWYASVELYELVGFNFLSPFVILSIILLMLLILYVLVVRRSIRVLVDIPVQRISDYLEAFMLSKSEKADMTTVGVREFDDILTYINELFGRVTEQARVIVKTQQEMYEKELLSSERTLYMNQLQINPHFLFNTLNTITKMCQAEGLDNVTVITHAVSDIFRYSIEGDYKATLDEEIYIVMKYLKIFGSRYGRDFPCELDVEEDLYEFEIMKMTLQPLIENSFKHGGLANVNDPCIRISAHREGTDIVIAVFDNGNGIPEDQLSVINRNLYEGNTKKDRGIGLLNVNRRIKICYGNQSGLSVESAVGAYTRIVIRIKDVKQSEGQ